jgi:PAS domain S-box-containing protein
MRVRASWFGVRSKSGSGVRPWKGQFSMSNDLDRAVLEAEVVHLRAEVERLRARCSPEPEHGSPITNADWRFLTESLRDILFYQLYIDHQGRHRFTYVSPAVKLMHGLTPEEVYADAASLRSLVLQDDLAGLLAAEAESIRTHTPFSYEVRMRAPGGAVRWILIRSAPFSVGEGTIWQGVEIDVTERRFSEDALRLSEDRFRAIVDQSPFSTIVFAANGEAVHVNEAHCRLWGVSRETVLGRDYNLLHDQQVAAVGLLPEVQRAFAGEQLVTAPVEYDLSATFGVGHKKVVRGDFFPARNAKGEVEFVILVHQDVTVQEQHAREQRKLQEQLQQAMKMEAVGRLAGGIAHDFNNLLTVIHGSLDLAEMDLHEPSVLRQHLEETRKASASASSLVRQLLAFSRRQIIEPKVIELNSLVTNLESGSIDLLMTDVVMPGMNGRQLAKRLTEQRPGLVVLFSSGFTENVIAHHGIIDEGLHYIAKPYSVAGLEAKLHEVLSAHSGR